MKNIFLIISLVFTTVSLFAQFGEKRPVTSNTGTGRVNDYGQGSSNLDGKYIKNFTLDPIKFRPGTANGQTFVYNSSTGQWELANGSSGNATSIQGIPVSATTPTSGQVLGYNGTSWIPTTSSGGGTGTGWKITISSTAPTDTTVIWAKSPLKAGVYDCYIRALGTWQKKAWLSQDGIFSWKKPIDILLAGQSNAAGGAYGSYGDTVQVKGILAYQSGWYPQTGTDGSYWTTARRGYYPFCCGGQNGGSSGNNISFQLAKNIVKNGDADIVRIITSYRGGTGLCAWTGDDASFKLIDSLVKDINLSGIDTLEILQWHQGENGSCTAVSSSIFAGYPYDFARMLDTFQKRLNYKFDKKYTKVIAGGIDNSKNPIPADYMIPEGALRALNVDGNPLTAFTFASGLQKGDGTHFTGNAIDTFGLRYYNAWKGMPRNLKDETNNYNYYTGGTTNYNTLIAGTQFRTFQNINGLYLWLYKNSSPLIGIDGTNSKILLGGAYQGNGFLNMTGHFDLLDNQGNLTIGNNLTNGVLNVSSQKSVFIVPYSTSQSYSGSFVEATAMGYNAFGGNSASQGNYSSFYGSHAGFNMSSGGGSGLNTLTGAYSGYKITGRNVVATGTRAGLSSASSSSVNLGNESAINSTGVGITGLGFQTANGNSGANNTYVGFNSSIKLDTSAAINCASTDISGSYVISNSNIAAFITARGLSAGNKVSLRFVASGQTYDGQVYLFTVTNSNTITVFDNYWSVLSATSFVLYPFVTNSYTNSTAVGANTVISASNTVYLGNPATTDLQTGAEIFTFGTGQKIIAGAGDPEGSVTAYPGSLYLRSTGVFYVKQSGTGNTGWVSK